MLKSPAQSLPPLFPTKYNLSLFFCCSFISIWLGFKLIRWYNWSSPQWSTDQLISWWKFQHFFPKIYLNVSWSTNQLNTDQLCENISLSKYCSPVSGSTDQKNTDVLWKFQIVYCLNTFPLVSWSTNQLNTYQLNNFVKIPACLNTPLLWSLQQIKSTLISWNFQHV